MDTALGALVALISCLALFDLAAIGFGADSRDGFVDDHRR
jgi:hypothetical protein